MEANLDIARGFTKRDKPLIDSLWSDLATQLNEAGPPQKDVVGWKKVWTDMKSDVKKKLGNNTMEGRGTGGGPFSKYTLNNLEEAIVRVCSMGKAVSGVRGIALGTEADEDVEDMVQDILTESHEKEVSEPPSPNILKRKLDGNTTVAQPKVRRVERNMEQFTKYLESSKAQTKELNTNFKAVVEGQKENASHVEKIYCALQDIRNDLNKFGSNIIKLLQDNNDLRQRQLDLEFLKFELEKKKCAETNVSDKKK